MTTLMMKRTLTKFLVAAALVAFPYQAAPGALGDWITAFVENNPAFHVPDSEVACLARVIYHEARGEQTPGKYAVAQVAMNRIEHPEFPSTVCGVIRAKNAFPWAAKDTTPKKSSAYMEARAMAVEIMKFHVHGIEWGPAKTKDSLFFNTVPFSYKRLKYDGKIGSHLFYSLKD